MKKRLVKINGDFCILSSDEIKVGDVAFTSNWEVTPVIDEKYLDEEVKKNPNGFRKIIASTAGIGFKLNKSYLDKILEKYYIKKLGEAAYKKFEHEYNFKKIEKKKQKTHTFDIVEFSHVDTYNKIKNQNLGLNVEIDENYKIKKIFL